MPLVVVLPFAPATARPRRPCMSMARPCERWRTRSPRRRTSTSSGFNSLIALETTTTAPSGTSATFAAAYPTAIRAPWARRSSSTGSSTLSDPLSCTPSARKSLATPDIPEPPTAIMCTCGTSARLGRDSEKSNLSFTPLPMLMPPSTSRRRPRRGRRACPRHRRGPDRRLRGALPRGAPRHARAARGSRRSRPA